MAVSRKARLTQGPIGMTLVRMTIPMVLGILGMVAFNLVDTFFVGQLGTAELAAMSFTFPVVFILNSLSLGLGVGASAMISRAIGEGNQNQVQRLTTDALILALSIVVVFVIVGVLSIDLVFTALGASPEILVLIREYMLIWYLGAFFVIVPMVGNNAIRATGDTKTPSLIMLTAVAVNIILDPLLIFGLGPFPRMELAGAALATVIARACIFVLSTWVLAKREEMLTRHWPGWAAMFASWRQILHIGLPAAGTNAVMPIGLGVLTSIVATFGPASVAAFGVASRIDAFAMTVVMALGSVLGPFVGQNWGAGLQERVRTGIKYAQGFALVWGFSMLALLNLVSRPLASIFNDNPEVIAGIVLYLSLAPFGYGFFGVLLLSNMSLNILKKPWHATALNLLQMFGLAVPMAYVGSQMFGLGGIFGAMAVAYVIAGSGAFFWLRRVLGQLPVPPLVPALPEAEPTPSRVAKPGSA